MTKSAMIKELIMKLLSDGSPHSVSEMKDYLNKKEMKDYTEGQFSGSVDNLLKNKKIEKIDRGTYRIAGMEMILTSSRKSPASKPPRRKRWVGTSLFPWECRLPRKSCDSSYEVMSK